MTQLARSTSSTTPPPRPPSGPRRKPLRVRGRLWHLYALILIAAGLSLYAGLRARAWAWKVSDGAHFGWDLQNAWRWGSYVVMRPHNLALATRAGRPRIDWHTFWQRYVTTYQRREHRDPGNYFLDYVPGKLFVAALWIWHERVLHPKADHWSQNTIGPLLDLNTALDILAAVAMFFLVRYWVIRGTRAVRPRGPPVVGRLMERLRGPKIQHPRVAFHPIYTPPRLAPATNEPDIRETAAILGLIAALGLWFNPAVIISGHAWAQWDVQLLAFYLLGMLLTSLDFFVLAGVVIALGALLKGQILFVSAIFIFWPLFEGRVGAAVRFALGFVVTGGLAMSPWLFHPGGTWWYLPSVALAAILAGAWCFIRPRANGFWRFLTLLVVPLILWPWWFGDPRLLWAAALFALLVAGLPWYLKRWQAGYYLLFAIAGAVVLIALTMRSSFAWWTVSYGYGTHHYLKLSFLDTCGLQNILEREFHFGLFTPVRLWGAFSLPLRSVLFLSFVLTLILCAWGAARQHRRNDPRFLVAMVAPWLTFFTLVPQMHERYLVWAAGLIPCVVAASVGLALLDIFLSAVTCAMLLAVMFSYSHVYANVVYQIRQTEPATGWAVALCAAIFMYVALVTRRGVPTAQKPGRLDGVHSGPAASNS